MEMTVQLRIDGRPCDVDEARSDSETIKAEMLAKIQERFGSTFIYSVSYNFLYN